MWIDWRQKQSECSDSSEQVNSTALRAGLICSNPETARADVCRLSSWMPNAAEMVRGAGGNQIVKLLWTEVSAADPWISGPNGEYHPLNTTHSCCSWKLPCPWEESVQTGTRVGASRQESLVSWSINHRPFNPLHLRRSTGYWNSAFTNHYDVGLT